MGHRAITLGMAVWLAVALVGCAGERAYVAQLRSPVPQERFQAVLWLAQHGSEKVLPDLIAALMDEDPSVRWAAFETLRERTGETLGYHPGDPEGRRFQAARRWEEWWKGRQAGPASQQEEPEKPQEGPERKSPPGQEGAPDPGGGRSELRTQA